jgi:glycine oxidase
VKITVVGAGVIGCAVAYELARRGAAVHVVDARPVGQGATQASAGMLAPYIEGESEGLLRLGVASLGLYERFVQRVGDETGRAIEFGRTGTLQVALDERDMAGLVLTAEVLDRSSRAHSCVGPDDLRRLEPGLSPRALRGLLIPEHGYVVAGALTSGLADAAVSRGARFSTGVVEAVAFDGPAVRVITSTGVLESDRVVLAAGSWTSRIAPEAVPTTPSLVRPVRGQLLHFAAVTPPVSHVVWRGSTYLVPWRDGSLLSGATMEDVGFDERTTEDGVLQLHASASEVLPGLAAAALRDVRVGLRPQTPDGLPIIGPSSTMPSVFYATGHFRSGVLLAPLTAALVADLVLEGRRGEGLEYTRPDRFGL